MHNVRRMPIIMHILETVYTICSLLPPYRITVTVSLVLTIKHTLQAQLNATLYLFVLQNPLKTVDPVSPLQHIKDTGINQILPNK